MKTRVLVLGMGGMGSAACYHLAQRGVEVIGIDRFSPPHDRGSSFGSTRIIRQAYFEDPRYIALAKKVYPLWAEIQAQGYSELFHQVGLLVLSKEKGGIAGSIAENAAEHGVTVEELSFEDLKTQFPQFALSEEYFGILEPNAGYLEVENAIRAHLELAERLGADLKRDETVIEWKSSARSVEVKTNKASYQGDYLCLCTGAWSASLLDNFGMSLTVKRAPQFWFEANDQYTEAEGMPCFAFAKGEQFIYGFPRIEGLGVKVSDYAPSTEIKDPLQVDPNYTAEELAPVQAVVRNFLPGLDPTPRRTQICMYTLTEDNNFLVGRHPVHENVILATGGSGHAFKFIPVIGERMARLVLGESAEGDEDEQFLEFR